jgi:hypothetical protein
MVERRRQRRRAAVRELRADVFSVFNIDNFGDPIGAVANAQFGRSTQMVNRALGGLNALYQIGGPRSAQFGVRVSF